MNCDLCEEFIGRKRIHFDNMTEGEGHKLNVILCQECKEWLEKILSIRSRYVQMMQEVRNY